MLNTSLFRRIELQLLMNLTARAFQKSSRRLWTHSNDEALRIYAEYTSDHLREGTDEALLQRMEHEAFRMGRFVRKAFLVRKPAKAERFIVALYHNIGIDVAFSDSRHLIFQCCYFSRYYTPAVCLVASALDNGIIRGITGQTASRLIFNERITEGCVHCQATFQENHQNKQI